MFAFFYNVILFFAEGAEHAAGESFYDRYLNFPGFEVWKFINLAIFVGLLIYILKRPLTAQFKAKRESIRAELIKAEEEKQAALTQLTAAEAKLAAIEAEKKSILKKAQEEAEAEKSNILNQTKAEIAKMREQAESEINRLVQVTKIELRRFSAEESVRLAEEKLRGTIDSDKDARLVKASIQEMGGLN